MPPKKDTKLAKRAAKRQPSPSPPKAKRGRPIKATPSSSPASKGKTLPKPKEAAKPISSKTPAKPQPVASKTSAKKSASLTPADPKDKSSVSAAKSAVKNPIPTPVKSPAASGRKPKIAADSPKKVDSPKKADSVPAKKTPSLKADVPATSPDPKAASSSVGKDEAKNGVKKTKTQENLVKVVTKGGAAVDSFVPGKDGFRVFQENGKVYSATLNQSNLDHNNNKFYIIQILQNEKTSAFSFWTRWGRVGVPGQNMMMPLPKDTAIKNYLTKVREKTVSGDYKEIQIKYDDDEEPAKKEAPKAVSTKKVQSKMDPGLQKLISLIFDVSIMNTTMKEIGYDAKKMPLGKLGDNTIKQAYQILTKLTEALKKSDRQQFKTLSSDFYTLIPHDFGFKPMINFILDNEEKVKEKLKMLEAISDMKITTKLLDQSSDDNLAVLDQNYTKLGCKIQTVKQNTEEYNLLEKYFDNTKGNYAKVRIQQAYEVTRPAEQAGFRKQLDNKLLLWHGSRISNFVGILSQGLRIAPPEAPVSGYLFGKGIYLADMAEKSINYCRSHGSDSALILLIEGAVGDPNVLLSPNSGAKQVMAANKKDSTKCHGSKAPPVDSYVKFKEMDIPVGPAKPTSSGSYMSHNEFIVYNMNQARIRYVLLMDMKGS